MSTGTDIGPCAPYSTRRAMSARARNVPTPAPGPPGGVLSAPKLTFAETIPISWTTHFLNLFRFVYSLLVLNNPLIWGLREGRQNPQADIEGPFYVAGAPDRTVAPGKAVLASAKELKGAPLPSSPNSDANQKADMFQSLPRPFSSSCAYSAPLARRSQTHMSTSGKPISREATATARTRSAVLRAPTPAAASSCSLFHRANMAPRMRSAPAISICASAPRSPVTGSAARR